MNRAQLLANLVTALSFGTTDFSRGFGLASCSATNVFT